MNQKNDVLEPLINLDDFLKTEQIESKESIYQFEESQVSTDDKCRKLRVRIRLGGGGGGGDGGGVIVLIIFCLCCYGIPICLFRKELYGCMKDLLCSRKINPHANQ